MVILSFTDLMSETNPTISCPGCRAQVGDIDGPTHRYIGAASGCWSIYCDVRAREYGEWNANDVHRLTVDTYAVQHPGVSSRRSIQSVVVHLVGLHMVLERDFPVRGATKVIQAVVKKSAAFTWLEPPESPGDMTILDVAQAQNLTEHEELVRRWARCVWDSWSDHHLTVKSWATTV